MTNEPSAEGCHRGKDHCLCAIGVRGIGRRDACRNLTAIVEAAIAVIGRQGLEAPLEDIAREAGLGIATLYRSCPSRVVLMHCVMAERLNQLGTSTDETESRAEVDPGEAFDSIFHQLFESSHSSILAYLLTYRDDEERVPDYVHEAYRKAFDRLEAVIRAAQDAGRVRPDIGLFDLALMAYTAQSTAGLTPQEHRVATARRAALCLSALHTAPLPLPEDKMDLRELGY